MRILFFIESLRAGGKERRIVELLKGLKKYPEIEIALALTRNEIHYEEIHQLGFPLYIIERKRLKKDPLLFYKFHKIVKAFKPDIVHVWGSMVGIYAIPSVVFGKLPMINNMITNTSPKHKWRNRLNFKFSTRIISNSFIGLKVYEAPQDKSHVIYNGFNFKRLEKIADTGFVKEKFHIKTALVVAMVATFSDHKDYETYIKASLNVLENNNEVTFLCVGEGNDATFKKMVPEKYNEKILFLGKQNNVEQIMNVCDIGVLTTNTKVHGEGISNALMEFMAVGKPVIATNFGGSVELLENNKNGYLVEAFDIIALADKLNLLLNNTERRAKMGLLGKERIEQVFNIDLMTEAFFKEYKNILN